MLSLTPVLFVDQIEPCLDFWYNLGYEKTMEVPEEGTDRAVFVAVQRDEVVIMYQTRAGLEDDLPEVVTGELSTSGMMLYVKVADLDDVNRRLRDATLLFPERTTFYGAREIGARAPCGTVIVFAEFADEDSDESE